MDLVNNLQQLLYTQGLLVFPARCLQTRSIWPYLHGAVRNLINQPQSASFALPKHPPGPDLVVVASVPRGGRGCLSPAWLLGCQPGVTHASPALRPVPEPGLCEHPGFLGVLVGAVWCFADGHHPSVLQRQQYWGFL